MVDIRSSHMACRAHTRTRTTDKTIKTFNRNTRQSSVDTLKPTNHARSEIIAHLLMESMNLEAFLMYGLPPITTLTYIASSS